MLVVKGPAAAPFDRHRGPGEWRAIRLRLKQAVLAANCGRAVETLGQDPAQVLVVGGPAGDEELLGVLSRSLPDGVAAGRGDVGGTCPGGPLGHRYAVASAWPWPARRGKGREGGGRGRVGGRGWGGQWAGGVSPVWGGVEGGRALGGAGGGWVGGEAGGHSLATSVSTS